MSPTTQLDRLEHLLLSQFHLINFWSAKTMAELTGLETKIDELTTAAAADRAAAEQSAAQVQAAIDLLNQLNATILLLKDQIAAGNAVSQEDIDRLTGKVTAGLADLSASAAAEAVADANLAAGVAANTPPAPPPAEPAA